MSAIIHLDTLRLMLFYVNNMSIYSELLRDNLPETMCSKE